MSEQDLQQLNNEPKRKKFNKVVDILLWVMIAVLAIALIIRAFVYTQITVSGESMMETFHDQEVVGVSKVKKPKHGDVVVFYKTDASNKFFDIFASRNSESGGKYEKLIKRCVALAGDRLWVEAVDGADDLYRVIVETPDETLRENFYKRNGNVLAEESFYITGTLATGSDLGELSKHIGKDNALTISDGCFFAMGDNRSNSSDSRSFGEVPLSRLYGVVVKT